MEASINCPDVAAPIILGISKFLGSSKKLFPDITRCKGWHCLAWLRVDMPQQESDVAFLMTFQPGTQAGRVNAASCQRQLEMPIWNGAPGWLGQTSRRLEKIALIVGRECIIQNGIPTNLVPGGHHCKGMASRCWAFFI